MTTGSIPRHSDTDEPEDYGFGVVRITDSLGRTITVPSDKYGNPSHKNISAERFVSPGIPFEQWFAFTNCVFDECILELQNCRFSKCTFRKCYSNGVQIGADRHGGDQNSIMNCRFDACDFIDCDFARVGISGSDFASCNFERCKYDHTTLFDRVHLSSDTKGLHTCIGLHLATFSKNHQSSLDSDVRALSLGAIERYASWERLRTFGRMPLFGVSFSALVAIPLATFAAATYNQQLLRLQLWVATHADEMPHRGSHLVEQMQTMALPSLTFWLLISTTLLALAAVLYALFCPPRVKEFSLEQWTDQLGHPALQYLAPSWSSRRIRIFVAFCYGIGGPVTALIFLFKAVEAGRYIAANTTLPVWLW